jgi:cytochrome b561
MARMQTRVEKEERLLHWTLFLIIVFVAGVMIAGSLARSAKMTRATTSPETKMPGESPLTAGGAAGSRP